MSCTIRPVTSTLTTDNYVKTITVPNRSTSLETATGTTKIFNESAFTLITTPSTMTRSDVTTATTISSAARAGKDQS